MTSVVFERVVSYSSEDPKYPARNLLHFGKPWRCAPGVTNATVILQLDEPRSIESIDIGNDHSAFVHVLVGRAAADEFQTLLPASSFMTAEESARSERTDRVRMFTRSDFIEPAASDKWDRIKVVCSQPFNRKVQFGLAFFVVRRPEEPGDRKQEEVPKPRPRPLASTSPAPTTPTLGHFSLKKDDDDDVAVGSLFARYRANGSQDSSSRSFEGLTPVPDMPTVSSTDEDDTHSGRLNRPASSPAPNSPPPTKKGKVMDKTGKPGKAGKAKVGKEDVPEKVKVKNEDAGSRVKVKKEDAGSKVKADKAAGVKAEVKEERKPQQQHVAKPSKPSKPSPPKTPSTPSKPFHRLLEGVVFSMSGYVNPLRATLREQALEMGAKYRPDWDSSCTHLICAFKNTPKFRQVQGHGRIVQKDWIQQCHSKRKRLPWRRFALDITDFKQPESEEEILEEIPGSAPHPGPSSSNTSSGITATTTVTTITTSNRRGAGEEEEDEDQEEEVEHRSRRSPLCRAESGSDTEEEIERLKNKTADASRVYQSETDEDDDDGGKQRRPVTSHLPLPPLPPTPKKPK